jgi:membrane-associated phospholipid phosphatase
MPRYRRCMPPSGPVGADATRTVSLAPRWAAPVAGAVLLLGALLAAAVWHATRLNPLDAQVYRWQENAYEHGRDVAAAVSDSLVPVVVLIALAGVVVGWRTHRRDAAVLAFMAIPATLAVEVALKRLVHRRWNGQPALIFPSGHVAVATAAAVIAVLVVRVAPVAPRTRLAVALLAWAYVLLIALARLVDTVHALTDLLGGVATGLAVTLGLAVAISGLTRSRHP